MNRIPKRSHNPARRGPRTSRAAQRAALSGLLLLILTALAHPLDAQPYPNVKINTRSNSPEETSIAINPHNPQNVVAVAQVPCHYYSSFDGGSTWIEGDLPDPRKLGDPAITFDRAGNAYYCYIGGWENSGIFVSRSSDGGVSWPSMGATIVANTGIIPFEDKSWPVCDWTNGPYKKNVYVAWTRFSVYGSDAPADSSWILFSRSWNSGEIFLPPIRVSDRGGDAVDSDNTVEGAVPAVGPDGTIYVAWAGPRGIEFDRSMNGGFTFGHDSVIADQPGGWDFLIAGLYRANGLPVTKTDLSFGPHRGRVFVNWSDQRNGDTDIFLIHSDDQGTTWSPPVRVNDDAVGNGAQQFFTWFDVDPVTGFVYVVFYDRRAYPTASTSTDVYLAISEDGGATFLNQKISASPFTPNPSVFFGDYNGISAFGGRVRPIWTRMDGNACSIWTALIDRVSAGITGPAPVRERLLVRPNPMRSAAQIISEGDSGFPQDLLIVDLQGRIVRLLAAANRERGGRAVSWDGTDASGRRVPSGIYFVTGRDLQSVRLTVVR